MGSLALDDELKNAICDAEIYFSVTLKKENLSPVAENQRQELGQRFATLKTKYKLISSKDEQIPPQRPPKNVGHSEEQELYDDVKDGEQKVTEQEEYDDIAKQEENYEVMSDGQPEYSEAAEETLGTTLQTSEKNTDPVTENYAEPEQEPEDYEIVSTGETKDTLPTGEQSALIVEPPETYEICETESQRDGSLNANLANLFEKVKVNEIQHVAYKGYLNKLRKPGKMFLGSKWQKRYCVVTDYLMYYFKTEKALSQKGAIVLPEYKINVTSHKNEHEFELTQEGHRTYKFSCENKEEFDKVVEVVRKATSRRLSGKESKAVEKILTQGDSSNDEDTSSITYDDVQAGNEASKDPKPSPPMESAAQGHAAEPVGENEEMYELVGEEAKENKNLSTTQPQNQKVSDATTEDEEQEMYDDVASGSSAHPQQVTPEEEIEEDLYELVGTEAKNPPVTSQQPAPRIEEPPPRTQPSIQPPPRSPETHLSSAAPTLPPPRTPEMQKASSAPALPPPRGSEKSTPGPALPPPRGLSSSAAPAIPPPRTAELSSGAPERPPPRSSTVATVEENGPPSQDGLPPPTSQTQIEELKEEEEEDELYDDVTTSPPSVPEGGINVRHDDEMPPPPDEAPTPTEESAPVRPPRRAKPDVPIRTTPVTARTNAAPSVKTPTKPAIQPKPKGAGRSTTPAVAPKPEPTKDIDYSRVYMAIWNCKADADDELEFTRGDLVYIYEKLQNDWWVGSLVQPQGYSLGLVPKNYLKEAFDLNSWKREACA